MFNASLDGAQLARADRHSINNLLEETSCLPSHSKLARTLQIPWLQWWAWFKALPLAGPVLLQWAKSIKAITTALSGHMHGGRLSSAREITVLGKVYCLPA